MSFQIAFDGPASADLTELLRAVEGQLNHRGMTLLTQMDAQAQTLASGTRPCDPRIEKCPTTTHVPHIAMLVVAFGLGVLVGYLIGRRSASAPRQ